jgi:mannose-1-phosphate guanylyltransferase
MEKTRRVLVVESDFGWDDVGTWDALERTMPHDPQGNVTEGNPVLIDARDCIVYNEPGGEECAVAVVGVEGLAVIVSRDAVLVMPKSHAQEVRKAVAELKKREAKQI